MSFAHPFPFDPTGGYSLEALQNLPAGSDPLGLSTLTEPADFADFWRATFAEAMRLPLDWKLTPSALTTRRDLDIFDIEFTGLAGNRVGGWLTRPRNRPVTRGAVVGHGYGGRGEPDLSLPIENVAAIFPVCTGLSSRSLVPGIAGNSSEHVLHGITHRETYVHRFNVTDLWRAASVLHEAVPESRPRFDYLGESFGGGIGALALPWDNRFHAAHLCVPSFGNHPVRLQLPCCGSGESVRLLAQKNPAIRDVLPYFDAALAARHIKIPVHVAAAAFDPAVPPAGQYSVYHSLGGPKNLYPLSAGHFDHPRTLNERFEFTQELRGFFK